ncbi:MAG TPA: competence/damage-inducible protein A, partial [Isosphaeraceae bacterium]|nr:competence/damage-inducible protein A [Isosphaeraceae bacterium]
MRAEIIAIGSELVSGQSLDTNSYWLSQQLTALGIAVAFHTTLGDVLDDHLVAFKNAVTRADVVVMTGGLGPTQDDLTREALARCAGVPLVEDAESLAAIAAMFARRNRVMSERNRVQALFPIGATPLPNPVGTA